MADVFSVKDFNIPDTPTLAESKEQKDKKESGDAEDR